MADSLEFGSKIKDIRTTKRYTVRQAAMQGGLSSSYLSQVENGRKGIPKVETLYKIAEGLRISNDEILELAGIINETSSNELKITGSNTVSIPIYGRISAGYPEGAKEDIEGSVKIDDDLIERYGEDNLIALRVNGESMNKVILNGVVAILAKVDPCEITNGDICGVIIDGEAATLKHVYQYPDRIRFEPDSWLPNFKPFEYSKEDIDNNQPPIQIIGKLVQMTATF